jgi:hypothetical protein
MKLFGALPFAEAIDLFETGQMRMDCAANVIEGRLVTFDDRGQSDQYKAVPACVPDPAPGSRGP